MMMFVLTMPVAYVVLGRHPGASPDQLLAKTSKDQDFESIAECMTRSSSFREV